MPRLSFRFQHRYELSGDEKVLVPIRLQLGNVTTIPLAAQLDTGCPFNVFRAEIADLLNIGYTKTKAVIKLSTATGNSFPAYGHQLTLEVMGSTLFFDRPSISLHGSRERDRTSAFLV